MSTIDLTNVPVTQKVAVANPDGTTPLNVALVSAGGTPDSYGAGAVDAGTQRMTQASDSPLVAVSGATSGAAVITDAAGTIQQYLRGLVKRWVDALGAGTAAAALRVVLPTDQTAIPVNVIAGQTGVAAGAGAVGVTVQRTTLASDDPLVTVSGATSGAKVITDANGTIQQYLRGLVYRPATGTESNVASSATDVTILASNANRMGATVFNDSTSVLYLLCSNATSSATLYTVQLAASAYYEVPAGYTGVLKGLWASANGNARVTELT